MLKKRKNNDKDESSPAFGPISSMETASHPSAPALSGEEKTVIGQHISVEGVVRGKENLVIEGSMKGSIELEKHQVTVGSKGNVEAEIHADNITISGKLVGNIKAHGKVRITREADFSGEIKAKRISVEDGAYLKAVIELEREDEKKKEGPSFKPVGQPVPGLDKPSPHIPPETIKGK